MLCIAKAVVSIYTISQHKIKLLFKTEGIHLNSQETKIQTKAFHSSMKVVNFTTHDILEQFNILFTMSTSKIYSMYKGVKSL